MRPGTAVNPATRIIGSLVGDGSRTLVQLATLDGCTKTGEAVYALGVPGEEPRGQWNWTAVGELNLDTMPLDRLLFAGLSAMAMKHVREAGVQIGDPVLVVGTDPWSLLLLQWARLQGASPLVFVCRGPAWLSDYAASLGVDATLPDPTPSDLARAVKATSRAGGFAIGLDGIANEQSLAQTLSVLRDGGRYVLSGLNPQRVVWLNAYPDLHRRDLEIVSPTHSTAEFDVARMWRFSLDLAGQARLRLDDLLNPGSGWRVELPAEAV